MYLPDAKWNKIDCAKTNIVSAKNVKRPSLTLVNISIFSS